MTPKPILSAGYSGTKIPVPTTPNVSKPLVETVPGKQKWSFSFQYFNQIQYFGLDRGVNNSWFVSLLERMKELSAMYPEEFFKDRILKDRWRYHTIDWNSKNIPITKDELNWVDKEFLENDIDFPFYQFMISKAKGRIVGFWNRGHTLFHIVLLDPLHNIQPAGRKYNYRVDDCYPLNCHYSSLTKDLEDIKSRPCTVKDCKTFSSLMSIPRKQNDTNAFVAYLDDDTINELNKILEKKSFSDIVIEAVYNNLQ